MKQIRLKRRSRVRLICVVCGQKYETHTYRKSTSKYCSKGCWNIRSILNKRFCLHCGVRYKNYNQKFCSRNCSIAYMVGEKASAYIDGKSMERERARDSKELKGWRIKVFKRDNYTCKECGYKKELHAHHIKEYALYPDLRFVVDNGKTLCIDCHGKIHNKDFHKKNKICVDCGKKVKVKGTRCHSCATKEQWRRLKVA